MFSRSVKIKTQIEENENYKLCVIKLKDVGYESYGIINKTTGVVEGVQAILSQALEMLGLLNKWLIAHRSPQSEQEPKKNPFEALDNVLK